LYGCKDRIWGRVSSSSFSKRAWYDDFRRSYELLVAVSFSRVLTF
jgi:hypothetical protein